MRIEHLKKIRDVLLETRPSVEDFSWGPTYEMALKRREVAIAIVESELVYVQAMLKDIVYE